MDYKMLLNKEKFLKTEFGLKLQALIWKWDLELQWSRNPEQQKEIDWCLAQWEVYQLAMKQFYGIEYHFTRTDEYFGVVTEDETDWLIKVDREPVSQKKAWTEYCNDVDELEDAFIRRLRAYALLLNASQKPDTTCCASHQEVKAAMRKTKQTADIAVFNGAIERYEIPDAIYIDSGVEVEKGSTEAFSQRMQAYSSLLDAGSQEVKDTRGKKREKNRKFVPSGNPYHVKCKKLEREARKDINPSLAE